MMMTKRINDLFEYLDGLTKLHNGDFTCAREIGECVRAIRTELELPDKSRAEQINELRDVQGQKGNYDVSDYMTGLYNGLELASATLEDREPEFKDKPDLIDVSTKTDERSSYDLSDVPTEELADELAKRDGVDRMFAYRGEGYLVEVEGDEFDIAGNGPALILVVKGDTKLGNTNEPAEYIANGKRVYPV